ncbi:MAG: hypothetical protein ACPHK2_04125, partial [Candidatus Poseidoniaceae archaeon]
TVYSADSPGLASWADGMSSTASEASADTIWEEYGMTLKMIIATNIPAVPKAGGCTPSLASIVSRDNRYTKG